jgi:hypothetical protein
MSLHSLSIQYHALPDENAAFIQKWGDAHSLRLLQINHSPFRVIEVAVDEVSLLLSRGAIEEVAFSIEKPSLLATTGGQLADLNPFLLYLRVGYLLSSGLNESWLTCRVPGPLPAAWTSMARGLRRATIGGAIARNPNTGKTSYIRDHRFSPKTVELSRRGIPMLALAGVCVYEPNHQS